METRGVLGGGTNVKRRFKVGNNAGQGQVVVADIAIGTYIAQVQSPSGNNVTTGALGIVLDASPPTYSTTQGTGANSPDRYVECTYHPLQMFAGRYSNTAAAYAAPAQELDGTILKAASANTAGTTCNDTNVGTTTSTSALLLCLSGNNPGQSRTIASNTANTSVTVTVPFDNDIAANDTFARLPNLLTGNGANAIWMTNDFKDFKAPGASQAMIGPASAGGMVVLDVEVGDAGGTYFSVTPMGGYEGGHTTTIPNATSPGFKLVMMFLDHVLNKRL